MASLSYILFLSLIFARFLLGNILAIGDSDL